MGGPVRRFSRSRHGMPFAAVVNQTRQGLGPASVFRARERGGHAWLADSPQSRTEPRWGTPPVSNLLGSHSRVEAVVHRVMGAQLIPRCTEMHVGTASVRDT